MKPIFAVLWMIAILFFGFGFISGMAIGLSVGTELAKEKS